MGRRRGCFSFPKDTHTLMAVRIGASITAIETQNAQSLESWKGSSQKPLLDVPADQDLYSLRRGQALVCLRAIDQAERKPSGAGNSITPIAIHDVLAESSKKGNFDWPHSQPIERIKAGLTEIDVAILLFLALVASCQFLTVHRSAEFRSVQPSCALSGK
jgi:hypothetical protein